MQVRQALDAGLALDGAAECSLVPFYLACAQYIVASMARLHAQDQLIHDLLVARIPAADADAHGRLAALDERQRQSRQLVATLEQAAEALRARGAEGLATFCAAARRFSAAINALLAPRRNPFFRYTDALFDAGDWARIASVTAESLANEERLFHAVQRTAPPGADPDQFTAVHLAPG